jgi:hypothetical protein
LGSTRKVDVNLEKTVKKTKFTPPSPIKATPATITSNDDIPVTFSDADDIMLTSPSQNKEVHVNYCTLPKKDSPEGKTTAVLAVMRGKPKDGCHRHCSHKDY